MEAAALETELDYLRRRNAELESRLAELEATLDSVPVFISYVGVDQRYKRVNAAYEQIFDVRREDMIGRTIQELTGEPHFTKARPYIERALAGERVSFESHIRHKDGTLHDLEVTYAPHILTDGTQRGFVVFVRDVTDERRSRDLIRERELDLQSVLNNVPDMISRYGPDLSFVFSSAAVERHTGIAAELVKGKTHAELGYPEELSRLLEDSLQRIFSTGQPESIRLEFNGPMGLRQYDAVGAPEFGEDGSVRSVLTVTHDITNLLRTEAELRRSEERQLLALEAGKVGIWHWDIDEDHVEWSDLVYKIHGLTPGTFGGNIESFSKLIHPDDKASISAALDKALAGQGEYHVEFRAIREDGTTCWIFANGRVVFDSGRAVRMLGAVIDVTESKAVAESLAQANEELRRANEDLHQFAYSASHDLKEPLRMVALYTQFLKRRYADRLDQEALEYIDFAVDGARRMDRLVHDLLEYTQAVHMDDDSPIRPVDVQLIFDQTVGNLHASIEESRATITNSKLPVIVWRETHAMQVMQNLIGNALKYRRNGQAPIIHVSAESSGKIWQFAVRDNGIGVDAQYHERIFGIFKRLHGNDKYEGTGIGLAICQKVIERNGGKIWIESVLNHGSTFYFTCPIAV